MLSEDDKEGIAYYLLSAREEDDFLSNPDGLFPVADLKEAYDIHQRMTKVMCTMGPHVGWKVGASSAATMAELGLQHPFRAPIHKTTLYETGSIFGKSAHNVKALSAQFAFVIGKPLPPRKKPYDMEEVWDAVQVVCPAMEVQGCRFSGEAYKAATPLQKICDGGQNVRCIVGGGVPSGNCRRDLDKVGVAFTVNGKPITKGTGSNVMDHPVKSLTWLANELIRSGISTADSQYGGTKGPGLLPGDFVMSGDIVSLQYEQFQPGDKVAATFDGPFSSVEVLVKPEGVAKM